MKPKIKQTSPRLFLLGLFVVMIGSYFIYRQHVRFEIETTFHEVAEAFQLGDQKQIFECMTPEYRARHDVGDAIQFWEHHNNWFDLKDGWSLSLSLSFREAWVYPFNDDFFELWSGPEYQLLKRNGKWLLTGESNIYLD